MAGMHSRYGCHPANADWADEEYATKTAIRLSISSSVICNIVQKLTHFLQITEDEH